MPVCSGGGRTALSRLSRGCQEWVRSVGFFVLGAQQGIFPVLAGTCPCSDGAVGPRGTVLERGLQSSALWAGPEAPVYFSQAKRVQDCVGGERLQNASGPAVGTEVKRTQESELKR